MTIHIDQIDEIRKRTGVGYAEAREALEANDYNLVEALVFLESEGKVKEEAEPAAGLGDSLRSGLNRLMQHRFTLKKEGRTVVDANLLVSGLFMLFTLPFTAALLLLALLTGHRPGLYTQKTEPTA